MAESGRQRRQFGLVQIVAELENNGAGPRGQLAALTGAPLPGHLRHFFPPAGITVASALGPPPAPPALALGACTASAAVIASAMICTACFLNSGVCISLRIICSTL